MDIWQYFEQKEREFDQWGVAVEPDRRNNATFRVEPGSNDERGFVSAKLGLGPDAFLSVFELVEVRAGAIEIVRYSYNLVMKSGPEYRWHKDPKNHPADPIHEHQGQRRITGTPERSLAWVLERAWEEVRLQQEAPLEG